MEKYIENKINTLSPEDKKEFDLTLDVVSQDEFWLSRRGLSNAPREIIEIILYQEMIEDNYSRLHGECFQNFFLNKMQFPRNDKTKRS